MRAGQLRDRLVLQKKTEARTNTGDVTITWTTDSTVWGQVQPVTGREYVASGGVQNEVTHRIYIRHHATVDDSWRAVNDGKVYSIKAVLNENNRDRMITLMCTQGVAEGGSLPSE